MKKRIFIAIELPKEIKKNLIKVQNEFKDLDAKFVKPEHIHLTLVFLGDIEESRISQIEQVCQEVSQKFSPFEIEFLGLSGFPNLSCVHTLWVGVKDSKNLINLQNELASKLKNNGFRTEERQFAPHLTLARLKRREKLENIIEKLNKVSFGKMRVEEFILFESQLFPEGPKHRIIKSLKLKL